MLMCSWETIPLRKTEVYDVNILSLRVLANDKIIWLDITMNEASLVKVFQSSQYLESNS